MFCVVAVLLLVGPMGVHSYWTTSGSSDLTKHKEQAMACGTNRFLIIGYHQLLIIVYCLFGMEHWLLNIDYWVLIIDYWLLIIDYWLLCVDYWLLFADYWLPLWLNIGRWYITHYWLLLGELDDWLLIIDYWLLNVDYW